MYFKLSFFSVVFHLICICAAGETDNKAFVHVFYETYCPDSIKFVTKQLYPVFANLNGSFFSPLMQPFGRANISAPNGTTTFTCQHGEKECYGNKVHACVLSFPEAISYKMKFISCSMAKTDLKNTNPQSYPIEECANESGLNAQTIKNCVGNTTHSDGLLIAFGNETKKYSIPSFPFVMFDGAFDVNASRESENNFAATICKKYITSNETKFEAVCNPKSSANTLVFTAFPVIALTFLYSKLF